MMKASSPYLLAAALGLALAGCDSPASTQNTARAPETAAAAGSAVAAPAADGSGGAPAVAAAPGEPAAAAARPVALPAGLKTGRWQGFLLAPKHAVHFVLEVAAEKNQAVAYLLNQGPAGRQRLRCFPIKALGDSARISLPGTAATLVVRANGQDHLSGAWVVPGGQSATRMAFTGVYGEQSPLRTDLATPNVAGTWRATFRSGKSDAYVATVVLAQQGPKLTASVAGPRGTYAFLSGAALPDGLGASSFDGTHAVLLQAKKLPNGTLQGDFYTGKSGHETWTAVPAGAAR